eukprot:615596-Pyramimonas_sp.AAC.1
MAMNSLCGRDAGGRRWGTEDGLASCYAAVPGVGALGPNAQDALKHAVPSLPPWRPGHRGRGGILAGG